MQILPWIWHIYISILEARNSCHHEPYKGQVLVMELLVAVSAMYTAWNSKSTMSLAGKLEAGID